jgi:16S rRNA (cytosine1402-N4)-methyltransferase
MHLPVMAEESVSWLAIGPAGVYLDGTLGGAGHALRIAAQLGPQGRLIGIDRDPQAIARCRDRFQDCAARAELIQGNYADMRELLAPLGVTELDGVLLDLGFSSFQVDDPQRGFSFMREGPLDMRMNPTAGRSAADWVNTEPEEVLAEVIFKYGEDRAARRIARVLVETREERPFTTTAQLAQAIEKVKKRRGRIHPATQTFQALRMAVNDELPSLERGLAAALDLVRPGGRVAVITFHSLEDRMVKHFFRAHEVREESLPQGGVREYFEEPPVKRVLRKPLKAAAEEREQNPRARSARLRVVERR